MQYIFKNCAYGEIPTTLIFAKKEEIFEMNYEDESIRTVYRFNNKFNMQPNYFVANQNQDILVVGSHDDGLWINLKKNHEVDIDELFNIITIT